VSLLEALGFERILDPQALNPLAMLQVFAKQALAARLKGGRHDE
jgi:hypothetical protein